MREPKVVRAGRVKIWVRDNGFFGTLLVEDNAQSMNPKRYYFPKAIYGGKPNPHCIVCGKPTGKDRVIIDGVDAMGNIQFRLCAHPSCLPEELRGGLHVHILEQEVI